MTSDEDDNTTHNDARLELNSIMPLKKYYPTQKLTSESSKLSTSAISSTDIFKNPVQRAESAPSHDSNQSPLHSQLLSTSLPINSTSANSLKSVSPSSPRNSSLLSVTLLKKLSFNLDTSNETHDCQENNNNLEKSQSKTLDLNLFNFFLIGFFLFKQIIIVKKKKNLIKQKIFKIQAKNSSNQIRHHRTLPKIRQIGAVVPDLVIKKRVTIENHH